MANKTEQKLCFWYRAQARLYEDQRGDGITLRDHEPLQCKIRVIIAVLTVQQHFERIEKL